VTADAALLEFGFWWMDETNVVIDVSLDGEVPTYDDGDKRWACTDGWLHDWLIEVARNRP
jgi:hypothetical protein